MTDNPAPDWLVAFVAESNRIEGILRDPLPAECAAHIALLDTPVVTLETVETFVSAVQPGAVLRRKPGLNVRVGGYIAPHGGPTIETRLASLLATLASADPWHTHCLYENLHPFTDGNGRSGRALWLWQMLRRDGPLACRQQATKLGFLHTFYYQTLERTDRPAKED